MRTHDVMFISCFQLRIQLEFLLLFQSISSNERIRVRQGRAFHRGTGELFDGIDQGNSQSKEGSALIGRNERSENSRHFLLDQNFIDAHKCLKAVQVLSLFTTIDNE